MNPSEYVLCSALDQYGINLAVLMEMKDSKGCYELFQQLGKDVYRVFYSGTPEDMRNHHGVAMAVRRKCGICMGTKIEVFNAVVTSTLLYASGTWTRREEHTKKLETAQYRMTTAYETLGMLPLRVVLVQQTLAWTAKLVNMDATQMLRRIMFSQMVKGKRL